MKQKAAGRAPDWRTEFSFAKDINPQKLKLLGAIALTWNFIEDIIDECLRTSLCLDYEISVDVTSRINGMEGKTAIIQRILSKNLIFTPDEKKLIKNVLDGVSEVKGYRDSLIHARVAEAKGSIAFTAPRKGNSYVITFEMKTLEGVIARMENLEFEAVGIFRLLDLGCFPEWEALPEGHIDPQKLRLSQEFQDALTLVRKHQTHRQSLEPLAKPEDPTLAHQA